MQEKTLCIIKPDAYRAGNVGAILAQIEENKFRIVALKLIRMDKDKASGFYAVHREKPFFGDLIRFMTSDAAVAMILEREGAIVALRKILGATDSAKASEGTIRHRFGTSVEKNAVHGSDSPESAAFEIRYLFPDVQFPPS